MTQRIVHLGVGNFHRAHQAWYTQRADMAAGTDWRIMGVSLRRPDVRDALKPRGFAYTLEIDDGSGPQYTTISVIDSILVAPENPAAVVAAIADPETALVTLTITEKGYCLKSADWRIDLDHPDIAADLRGGEPSSAVGILVAGLARRREAGLFGLTVLSCDNLPDNGKTLEKAVHDFAADVDGGLAEWIAATVAFPSCMVDRITPATTEELRQRVLAVTGVRDAAPVATEGFSQWVIEDRFSGPRPAWELAGAELVPDVRPYELRKLRMLNGAHSTLAYAGLLAGYEYVHQAIADPELRGLAQSVMDEAAETLPDSVRSSADDYAAELIRRFGNPGLHHQLIQIAMDGSQKLPVRLLAPMRDRLQAEQPSPALEAGVAAWIGFAWRQTRGSVALDDPLADQLAATCAEAATSEAAANAILAVAGVFGSFAEDHPGAAERIARSVGQSVQ